MKAFAWHEGFEEEAGMDLRDYFAAKAMQGLIANPKVNEQWSEEKVAYWAYTQADAMMEAR